MNFSNVNPGINAKDDKAKNDENEEDGDEADVNNNDTIFDDEDSGIVLNDDPIEYDELNIYITAGNFRMGGRHTVFGFYRELASPFKQVRKKLGIICILCDKAFDGTNNDQRKCLKCARFITNNTTNLLYHLDNKHDDVSIFEALLRNKKRKGLVESGT